MNSIFHWGVTDGVRLSRTVGKELDDPSSFTTEEFIKAAEISLKKYPNDWVIYYSLGDKYQELGYYAESLESTRKCVEIRPNDIRSTYALATSYNILTRSSWSESEQQAAKLYKSIISHIDKADKRYSQAGLDHTGLAVETAAIQAIRWFERSLDLNPDSESRNQINEDLVTLYRRFPNLQR